MSFLMALPALLASIHLKLRRMGIFSPPISHRPPSHTRAHLSWHAPFQTWNAPLLSYSSFKSWFCHQSCHLIRRGEGLTPRESCSLGWEALVAFVLLCLLRSTWGKFVADGSIHVLSLAFCFSVYGFAFIFQIHFSIHLFSLFCSAFIPFSFLLSSLVFHWVCLIICLLAILNRLWFSFPWCKI